MILKFHNVENALTSCYTSIFIWQTNTQLDYAGSYQCTASTKYHSSSSTGQLIVRDYWRFETRITPPSINVKIGGTAKYACKVFPLKPLGNNVRLTYTWSRKDNRPISSNAVGVNTNTLTLVSILCPFDKFVYMNF